MSDAVTGAAAGVTAGANAGGGWGALAGGAIGGLAGLFSDYQTAKAKRAARKELSAWQDEAEQILEDSRNNSVKLSSDGDLETYQSLRDSFDPNDYVLSDDELNGFDKDSYNVEDYLNKNADRIRQNVANTIQHTAAGSAMGHSSGTAASIVQGVMDKDEELYKDAREQMNEDRNFDYGVYSNYIQNKQNQLNTLMNGTQTQMNNLRSDITFDQQQEDNYVTNKLNLGNTVAQTKAQLV